MSAHAPELGPEDFPLPPGIDAPGRGVRRESHLQSADDAEGIFDLYSASRDSQRLSSNSTSTDVDGPLPRGQAKPNRSRLFRLPDRADVEELANDPPGRPDSWSGPMAAMNLGESTQDRDSKRSLSGIVTPGITVTPDHSQHATPQKHVLHRPPSSESNALRSSTISSSSAGSPVHPSFARLSPRHPSNNTSASASQVSFGSSQYPGEENDAFHVRSTYARLEAEGVHGDGWDPGVERTRGGPSQGKRSTVRDLQVSGDVGEKERAYLESLDRYGFVEEPLHKRFETRIALVPSHPFKTVPKLPSRSPIPDTERKAAPQPMAFQANGNERTPPAPAAPRAVPGEDERARRKEDERVGKWMKMMTVAQRDQGSNIKSWSWRPGMEGKLSKRVYKGIPDRWRMAAWWTLAEERADRKGKRRARSAEDIMQEYRNKIDLPSPHDVQIDLDVPRTISGHTMFVTRYGSGQRSLFHVLHCFSMLCDTCGYCQGMGPIAATLLCYFDPERAYVLLVRLHDDYGMHSIFAPGFPGLLEVFYVQERLMEWLMPDVYRSFQRNMISSSAWGTKWYITLFVNTIPFSQQLRLWDALWLDGRDIMIVFSVAILWAFKDLLTDPAATFESILSLLSSFFVAEDDDALMTWVRKMIDQPGMREKISGWRMEWLHMVKENKSDGVLL